MPESKPALLYLKTVFGSYLVFGGGVQKKMIFFSYLKQKKVRLQKPI